MVYDHDHDLKIVISCQDSFIWAIFAIWGQSQLLICPVYLVILWRYNSLIPFMCLLILADWGLRLHFSRD